MSILGTELYPEAEEIISKKFNILFSIDCRGGDTKLHYLSELIDKIKKEQFSPNDRILLVHMDTDYYDPLLPYGLLIINLIRLFKNKDIPLYLLLFVTNHYGIKEEFDQLLINQPPGDYPTIVETLLSPALLGNDYANTTDFNFDKIEKAGLCMLGAERSHRVALSNFIKDNNLLPNIALQTNFNKQ